MPYYDNRDSSSLPALLQYFAIVSTLFSEHILLKSTLTRAEIGRLSRIDAVYGLAALTLIVVGLTLWLGGFGNPAIDYTKNWIFHAKLTLFLVVGLFSVYPAIFFIKNGMGNPNEIIAILAAVSDLTIVQGPGKDESVYERVSFRSAVLHDEIKLTDYGVIEAGSSILLVYFNKKTKELIAETF